jgi:eukaryotic-like serine/threonine-protein kinase
MSIAPGTKLSSFEILEQLGRGGMGEVYRARDSRLNREVALKFLNEISSAEPERIARFAREAQVLASLNHPHIAAIYGIEEANGVRCLVLELVEGETLAQRLSRGPLPLAEALQYARQIASALEAAHERGVVHRDLKPGNVSVTPEGAVKVLDFGLAKALEPDEVRVTDLSRSPTLTTPATRLGVILGTAAYMSPEQARGREVDKRADIWAFGCVLYEMLTGRQAFSGETVSDIMASVLKTEADLQALPAETPASVRRLLARCLQRDVQLRLRDIGEARILLDDILAGRDEPPPAAVLPARTAGLPPAGLLAVAIAAIALAAVLGWWLRSPVPGGVPLRKVEIAIESMDVRRAFSISPDGKRIVYTSENRLWVRELDQLEAHELRGTDGANYPFWSPDSAFIGYYLERRMWKVPARGGAPVLISQVGDFGGGAGSTWTAGDEIVFSRGNTGLFMAPASGGDARPYLDLGEGEQDFHEPSALPDGRGLVYVLHRDGGSPDTLALYDGKQKKELVRVDGGSIWSPSYSHTGHIIYQRAGLNPGIWALPFSLSSLEATGPPFLVLANANRPSVSRDGTLVCARGADGGLQLVEVDRSGNVMEELGTPQEFVGQPAYSPDGRRLAAAMNDGDSTNVWTYDLDRGTRTRLTFSATNEVLPAWSPDGQWIVHVRLDGPSLVLRRSDGTGQEEVLGTGTMPSFSPDGKFIVYSQSGKETRGDIWYLPLAGERKPVLLVASQANEEMPVISPDGTYLAYVSDESGRPEVYLTRFPSGEGKWQASVDGGLYPAWNRKGNRMYFRDASRSVIELDVNTSGPALVLGRPRPLFSGTQAALILEPPFGFAARGDGHRLVATQEPSQAQGSQQLTLIQNWYAEFALKEDLR